MSDLYCENCGCEIEMYDEDAVQVRSNGLVFCCKECAMEYFDLIPFDWCYWTYINEHISFRKDEYAD